MPWNPRHETAKDWITHEMFQARVTFPRLR
jgi:hypothetical protein